MRQVWLGVLSGVMLAGGVASARPGFEGREQPHRDGTPPPGALRADVVVRINAGDGPEARDRLERPVSTAPADRSGGRPADTGLQRTPHVAVPLRADILVRVNHDTGRDEARPPLAARVAADDEDPKFSHESMARLPIKFEIAQHMPQRENPDSVSSSPSSSRGASAASAGMGNGVSSATIDQINRQLAVPLPDWMVTKMMAGAKHVEFDDPKLDRLNVFHRRYAGSDQAPHSGQ